MYINLNEAIAAVESAIRYTFDQCCLNTAYAATEVLRALPTVSVMDDDIERIALQNAKEYLQGVGPWKLDEIGITSDDYLVKCFVKAIREAALGSLPAPPNPMHYGPMHDLQIDPNYVVKTQTVKSFDDEYNASPTWPAPTIEGE